eukprot:10400663-Lingulodinium_polyedra.AAC.1
MARRRWRSRAGRPQTRTRRRTTGPPGCTASSQTFGGHCGVRCARRTPMTGASARPSTSGTLSGSASRTP